MALYFQYKMCRKIRKEIMKIQRDERDRSRKSSSCGSTRDINTNVKRIKREDGTRLDQSTDITYLDFLITQQHWRWSIQQFINKTEMTVQIL